MADSTIDVMTDLTPQVASTIVNLAIEMMIISEAQYLLCGLISMIRWFVQ